MLGDDIDKLISSLDICFYHVCKSVRDGGFLLAFTFMSTRAQTTINFTHRNTQVAVYNPLAHNRTAHIRLPVSMSRVVVTDASTGLNIPAEMLPGPKGSEMVLALDLCPLCSRLLRVSAAPTGSVAGPATQVQNTLENGTYHEIPGDFVAIVRKSQMQ